MKQQSAAPSDWIDSKKWILVNSLADEDGIIPQLEFDPVNPTLARDLRDSYRLVGQLGAPAIRVAQDRHNQLFAWLPDVKRWQAWAENERDGVVEIGSLR